MNRKTTIIALILVFLLILTITTCELLNKDMKLILPPYLYDGDPDTSVGDGIVQIFNFEETETTIVLTIVPADEDIQENENNDSEDLTKILTIPPYVIILKNELSVEFTCQAMDTEMTNSAKYKDITVEASSRRYNEAEDTVRVFDIAPEPTAKPTDVPTDAPTDEPTGAPTTRPAERRTPAPYKPE